MKDSSELMRSPPCHALRKVWILGAGRFGFMAAQRLGRRYPEASITVVDAREDRLDRIREELGTPTCREDAISFLTGAELPDDIWVVPAVPVHVAFQWLLTRLDLPGKAVALPVPEAVDPQVPNPYRGPVGSVYASFATFLCPDNCSEPEEICTYTRKPRQGNLFERLRQVVVEGFRATVVVRSLQLAPGIGGYTGRDLHAALAVISRSPGSYLVATSCRCHGVIDALAWSSK